MRGLIESQEQMPAPMQLRLPAAVESSVIDSASDSHAMTDVLKPFFVLACVAFVAGFMGFLALARLSAPDGASDQLWQAPLSASAPTDDATARDSRIA